MALVLPAESDHTKAQALLALEATRLARRSWRSGMGSDFDAGWARVRPAVEVVTREAMVGSATNASRLVPRQLAQAGHSARPGAALAPEAFGTQTMLGVDVAQALDSAPIRAKQAISSGATTDQALEVGEEWLDELIRSVMADVDRAAQQAAITATPRMGWVRIVPAPCCKRCAVLAGRWYRYSAGFERHRRCDCYHRPAPQDLSGTSDLASPEDLALAGGIKDLTADELRAITDGATASQVINASRVRTLRDGTRVRSVSADGMTTTEGTTRRGSFGRADPGRQRLTPAAIYRLSSDRDEAIRLLAANGYLR